MVNINRDSEEMKGKYLVSMLIFDVFSESFFLFISHLVQYLVLLTVITILSFNKDPLNHYFIKLFLLNTANILGN